jgi:hypothetical protein
MPPSNWPPARWDDPRSPIPQTSDDRAQASQAEVAAQAGRHHEIGSLTFLAIRHLIFQDRRQAAFGHSGSP